MTKGPVTAEEPPATQAHAGMSPATRPAHAALPPPGPASGARLLAQWRR